MMKKDFKQFKEHDDLDRRTKWKIWRVLYVK